jgi:hypothetical protein
MVHKRPLIRTSATGPRVSITHLIRSRALSHVSQRLIVVIASLASRRAFSASGIPAGRLVTAGGGLPISMGRRSAGSGRASDPVATADRVVFTEPGAIEDTYSPGDDSLTSVDWRLVASMAKIG